MSERLRSKLNLEDGLGLIEVIVAMFVLFVLAIAILPALVGATSLSVTNKSFVAATNFANQQIAAMRANFPNDPPTAPSACSTLRSAPYAIVGGGPTYSAAPANIPSGLTATITVNPAGCTSASSTAPGTAAVTVTVGTSSQPAMVTISTIIVVYKS